MITLGARVVLQMYPLKLDSITLHFDGLWFQTKQIIFGDIYSNIHQTTVNEKKTKLETEKGGMWMVLWGVNGMEEMM